MKRRSMRIIFTIGVIILSAFLFATAGNVIIILFSTIFGILFHMAPAIHRTALLFTAFLMSVIPSTIITIMNCNARVKEYITKKEFNIAQIISFMVLFIVMYTVMIYVAENFH